MKIKAIRIHWRSLGRICFILFRNCGCFAFIHLSLLKNYLWATFKDLIDWHLVYCWHYRFNSKFYCIYYFDRILV